MDGERVLRMEVDDDEDGRIDRWVYFRVDGSVDKIGRSTSHSGQPETWTYPSTELVSAQSTSK